ncbi:MAG: VOC family protein [Atribacterota bacterium]|jgi:predicted enzyme related to lactoylglutathione lyase|nr:VOC family protein [Atribacterota bacterium]MDD4896069.1 VOC family protein [Atribacterota bacterium]MDD5636913.1 VOC family protein [Atribacterota bacterium]
MSEKVISFQHVGLSVTNLKLAVNFYKKVFGLKELSMPKKSYCSEEKKKERRKDIFGSKMMEVKVAHLITNNGVGLELFEFIEPKSTIRKRNFEYWKSGIFHISFNVSDLDETIQKIIKHKGKMISKVWELFPGCQTAYCQDPFGNVFEILNCTYEEMATEKISCAN